MSALMLHPRNPMTKVLLSVLLFEVICCGLAIPVMITIDGVPGATAGIVGGSVALLALIAAGAMRSARIGYPIGWLSQIGAVSMGLLTPGMWFVGGLFAGLWIISFVLGKRLEKLEAQPQDAATSS